MTLSAGTRLGPYEVVAPLGAGGMGEVYRARDTRLSREVALKVLPAEVSSDPARLRRFEKEARSASSLNHPNIVTVYDIGTSDAVSWIAMEKVEGKTLRELLLAGQLPVKRLLQIASQIADGLAKAHEAGIVHRDLKPENVMVTKDGLVKVLDFGLAKLTQTGVGSDEASQLPTETGTSPGMIVGTVGYMSPEQASAQSVDFRSDQFSFGSILYEMATGKRAFQKGTAVDTLSAILHEEPQPVAEINPQAPAPLRWIIERCHGKDADARYASTKDLARELATVRDHLSDASAPGALESTLPRRRRPAHWIRLLLTLLAVIAVSIFAGGHLARVRPPEFTRLTFRRGMVTSARFAPDGQTVIYGAEWDGKPREIFQTRPGSPESRSFGLTDAELLAVSGAGDLAILRGQTLAQMPMAGGAPRDLLEGVIYADWSPDGKQIAVSMGKPGVGEGGTRLEYPIGKLLYEGANLCPRVSPDGRRVAFDQRGAVLVVEPDGEIRTLTAGWKVAYGLAWSPKGNGVWFGAAKVGFAEQVYGVDLSGRVRLVAAFPGGVRLLDVSRSGRVLVTRDNLRFQISGRLAGSAREQDLSWLDNSMAVDLSADGRTLLFREAGEGGGTSVATYLRRVGDAQAIRLGEGFPQALSPDGKWALVAKPDTGGLTLVLLPTGAGQPRSLDTPPLDELGGVTFFPDSRRIAIFGKTGNAFRGYVLSLEAGKVEPLTPEGYGGGPVSPDGKWILLRKLESGKWFVFPIAGGEPRPLNGLDDVVEAPSLATYPSSVQWSADSRALFAHAHSKNETKVFRVDVATGRREPWLTLVPPDPAGISGSPEPILTPDGKSYVYSYIRDLNDLYLVEGLR